MSEAAREWSIDTRIGVGLFFAAFAALLFTEQPVGFSRDESVYFYAAENHAHWFQAVLASPSTAFQDAIEMTVTGQSQTDAAAVFDGLLPLGRHTTPQEIAQAALYLASDASAMVTSTTFSIDAGLRG